MSKALKRYDAKTFYENIQYQGASFSSDESMILFSSDATGIFNLFSQPVLGGKASQLTWSKTNAVLGVDYFPRDDRILYTSDQGGNELNHIYVLDGDDSVRDLTPGINLKAQFLSWSGDETSFWILSTERDPKYFDLYLYQVDTYERKLVYRNEGDYGTVSAVSRDGRWIALLKTRTNADNDIYVVDRNKPDETPRLITPHTGDVLHSVQDFHPDNNQLYYLSNADREYMRVWTCDLGSGRHRLVEQAPWDILFMEFSRNGRFRITAVNEDARTKITIRDLVTGQPLEFPEIPKGDMTSAKISGSGRYVAFYVDADTSPPNLYLLDLVQKKCTKLTESLNPAIAQADLVESEIVRYPSYDGLAIPALLYKPHGASRKRKVPGIIRVHGGPGGQARVGYSAERQFLVNHGYAILDVNNRGSSGYGKTFHHMDDKRHGDVDLKDCVWGRRYLEGLDWVDGRHVAILGGSYGGYMVAAALAFEPEAFDAGIDIFGVTNWVRTLRSIPPWWETQRDSLYAELGNPYKEEEMLRRKSPLFHASSIRRPLLVVQGKNDPRVLQVESDELVEAVKQNNVPVEYIVFPDEGHGFRNKANRIDAAEAYLRFLDRYLKPRKE